MLKFWYDQKKYLVTDTLEEEYAKIRKEPELKEFIKKHKLKVLKEETLDIEGPGGVRTKVEARVIALEELVEKQTAMIQELLDKAKPTK